MRGVWRAWFYGLALGLGPVAVVLAVDHTPSLTAGVLLTGLLASTPGLLTLRLTIESERFVEGLRRSCGRVHVVDDRLDWGLRRQTVIETPVGTWKLQSDLKSVGPGLIVEPPETHGSYCVQEDPRQAGRVLMARLLTAQPAPGEDRSETTSRREAKAHRAQRA